MNALVVGGAGSGKSAFAERLACSLGEPRTYLATMQDVGSEAHERIRRHREQRSQLRFGTVECHGYLPSPQEAPDKEGVALLDDLGNLVADALFLPDGTMCNPSGVLERITSEVIALSKGYRHLVVVGNDVGSAGPFEYESTDAWVRLVGALCCRIAAQFDVVVEVVSGQPIVVKGVLP